MEVLLGTQSYTITLSFSKKIHAPFSFKRKSELIENCLFDSNQFSQNFIWKNQTALQVIVANNQVSQKSLQYILKDMIMLLLSIMVLCLYGVMMQWLWRWIPNPGVPSSKPLGASKVNSAIYSSEIYQMSTRISLGLTGKK